MILIIILILIFLTFYQEKFFTNNPIKSHYPLKTIGYLFNNIFFSKDFSDNIYKKCKNLKVREDGLLCGYCLTADNINYNYSCNFCKLNNYGLRNGNLVCH
jgi:hypothetical protein